MVESVDRCGGLCRALSMLCVGALLPVLKVGAEELHCAGCEVEFCL